MSIRHARIDAFDFAPGREIGGRYVVEDFLGGGWEGEVYRVVERRTGIPRAAKFFYPHRNESDKAVRYYARKLDRLRRCPIVIQYHHSGSLRYRNALVTYLVSELVEGELLEHFARRQPGQRLHPFEALVLLHSLAGGMEQVHAMREYHGDLHDNNVLVQRRGVRFEVKILDFYHWGPPSRANIQEDVIRMVRMLYDAVGGRARYARQPQAIKRVCLGLRRDLIVRKFPTAGHLRAYLEGFAWD